MAENIDVNRCRSRIAQMAKTGTFDDLGVAASLGDFSARRPEVLTVTDWSHSYYEAQIAGERSAPSLVRVAEAVGLLCTGCKVSCEVMDWVSLVPVQVHALTSPKPEYTDEPMPRAPGSDDTHELITA